MERVLAGIGLGIGILAALLSLLVPSALGTAAAKQSRLRITKGLLLGAVLTILLFSATFYEEYPFSPGHRLGWGILVGGLAALLSALGAARLPRPSVGYWPYPSVLASALSLSALSLTVIIFPGDPVDGLLGCALGIVMVTGIFRCLPSVESPPTHAGSATAAPGDFGPALEAGAGLAVTLAAACCLAVYHFHRTDMRGWWAYGLALAAFWLLGHLLSYIAAAQRSAARYPVLLLVLASALGIALVITLGAMLGARLEPAEKLTLLLASGAVTTALIAWLSLTAAAADHTLLRGIQTGGLAAILVLVLLIIGFKALAGFGAALTLIAGWGVAIAALSYGGAAAQIPMQALALGTSFLLLRLFLERFGAGLGDVDLSVHYTLIGLLIGALLPLVFSALYPRPGVGRAILLLVLGALAVPAVLALWGLDAVLGLLLGLIAAQGIVVLARLVVPATPTPTEGPEHAAWVAPAGILGLGIALVAVQFSQSLAFLYEVPRAAKVYLAGGIALAALLWIIGLGLLRLRKRTPGPGRAPAESGETNP
jgi:hypothetical protein